jgi:hypothetical protein
MRIPVMLLLLLPFSATSTSKAQTAPAETSKPESAPVKPDDAKPKLSQGGVQILSDTQGVDFKPWIKHWRHITEKTWLPLIPDDVNPPTLLRGIVAIRIKVLPNGRLKDGSMVLEGRSGHTALDKAAWAALTGSNYPPLPSEFKGPFLELRTIFVYNMEPSAEVTR